MCTYAKQDSYDTCTRTVCNGYAALVANSAFSGWSLPSWEDLQQLRIVFNAQGGGWNMPVCGAGYPSLQGCYIGNSCIGAYGSECHPWTTWYSYGGQVWLTSSHSVPWEHPDHSAGTYMQRHWYFKGERRHTGSVILVKKN